MNKFERAIPAVPPKCDGNVINKAFLRVQGPLVLSHALPALVHSTLPRGGHGRWPQWRQQPYRGLVIPPDVLQSLSVDNTMQS